MFIYYPLANKTKPNIREITVTSDTHKLAKRTVISNSPALVHIMAGIL